MSTAFLIPFLLVSWTKDSVMMPMRDQTELNTNLYFPNDTTQFPLPVLLMRTPYGADNAMNNNTIARWTDGRGYIVATQDCRGRFESQGIDSVFLDDGWRCDKRDGHDAVDWLSSQPWCSGRVGTIGGSACAITQLLLAGASHPAHSCANPVVGAFDMYRHAALPGGEMRQYDIDYWLTRQNARHMLEYYADHYCKDSVWDYLDVWTRQDSLRTPMLFYGGWYDIFSQGTVEGFQACRRLGNARLVMGPWSHLIGIPLVGEILYPRGVFDSLQAFADRWYDWWLKDSGSISHIPPVSYYLMGPVDTAGFWNNWLTADDWPPSADTFCLYLRGGSSLSFYRPGSSEPPDTFVYDPRDPVPSNGGNNLALAAGPRNQHDQLYRDDVLCYVSPPLEQDVVIEGRIWVRLHASSDRLDTDFTAKLVDLYNDARQRKMLVIDGILMARHRNGLGSENLLVPGQVYEFNIDLGNTAYCFPAGHRICLAISSSNSPRFRTNLNNGGHPLRDTVDTIAATNVVHHSAEHPSRMVFQGQGPTGITGPSRGSRVRRGSLLEGTFDAAGRRVLGPGINPATRALRPGCYFQARSGQTRKFVLVE